MYHGIRFGDKDSYEDFGLVPTSRPLFHPAEPNYIKTEVPGRDGALDNSRALTGEITYKERTGEFEFKVEEGRNWAEVYSEIQNYLHGKKMKVILEDDPDFYYDCELKVNDWKSEEMESLIVIDAMAYPYKRKINETVIHSAVAGTKNIFFENLRERVMPTISTDAEMTVEYEGKSITTSATFKSHPDFIFHEGENKITVSGIGNITISFREGSL